jgi:hypothetical protein
MENIWKKIPESSKKQSFSLPHANHYTDSMQMEAMCGQTLLLPRPSSLSPAFSA